jgi:hypothetical protein
MQRPALRLAALLVAVALHVTASSGCGPRGLAKIEVPAGGVTMKYELQPGAMYSGRLRLGNTRTVEGAGNVSQSLDCEVQLVVVEAADGARGGLLRATFSNIDLKWGLPPSAPMSPEEFTKTAIARLQGMNVAFRVKPTGEIVEMPAPPQDLPEVEKQFIDAVLRALEQAFFELPTRAVKDDETWSEDEQRGREGKLGRYVIGKTQTRVDGMFRDESRNEDLVRLVVSRKRTETITTKDGSRKNESEGKMTAMFSTKGWLAQLEGESRDFDPVEGMTFSKVKVDWKRVDAAGLGGATGNTTDPCDPGYTGDAPCSDGTEQQDITDPCHPDYVGAQECKADAAADPAATAPPAADAPAAPAPDATATPAGAPT